MMEVLRSASLRVSLCKQPDVQEEDVRGARTGVRRAATLVAQEEVAFTQGWHWAPVGAPPRPLSTRPPLPSRLTRARSAGRGPRVGASTGLLALQERGAQGVGVGCGETTSLGVTPGHVLGECSGGA